jgi:hypothetical protein
VWSVGRRMARAPAERYHRGVSEPIDVSIGYLPGWIDENALVSPLGDDLYRLELQPMWSWQIDLQRGRDLLRPRAGERRRLPDYGDVIEACEIAPGLLRFVRVVERARLRRYSFFGWKRGPDTPFERMLDRVAEQGGHWECVFTSFWTIYLPRDSDFDPKQYLREHADPQAGGGAAAGDAV